MFIQNMMTAFSQVTILAILAAVGFFCHKSGLYTEKAAKLSNGLLFYIVTPSVICQSFLRLKFDTSSLNLLLAALVCGVIYHTVGAVLVHFLFKKSGDAGVYRYACMYGNIGYMGIPLSQAVLGDIGVFICSIMVFIFNAFAFTHGVRLMDSGQDKFNWKKMIFNPGTIGIAMGLPCYLLQLQLPNVIGTPLSHLANLNTPLAMVMFGTYLADTNLKKIFTCKKNYIVVLIKLILLPVLTISACKLAGISGNLLVGCTLLSCVPSACNTVMFAAQFHQDTAKAGMVTAFAGILSIITMPVWIALAQSL